MKIILKPAGVLFVIGSLTALAAVAVTRPVKQQTEQLAETGPVVDYGATRKKKALFDDKSALIPINLTESGSVDWVAWGVGKDSKTARRSGGSKLFSEAVCAGALETGKHGPSRAFTWKNGDLALTEKAVYPGLHTSNDDGFTFKAAVDTAPHTLSVYVGGYKAGGEMVTTLSDGTKSEVSYKDLALAEGYYSGIYSVRFRATKPGTTISVQLKRKAGGGNISLQAAALQ
jgi:hypothetical protein